MNKKMQKLVSVVMSVYNEPFHYIEQAVDSIINQTYPRIEIIIIIDNPGNVEIIDRLNEKYRDTDQIKIIVNGQNMGLAESLNVGIDYANGFYIARMDADDISLPDRISKEINYLEAQGLDLVACAVEKIDGDGNSLGAIHPTAISPEEISRYIAYKNPIVHPTVIMKTEAVRSVGKYRNFNACQDYDLWTRFVTQGYKLGQLDEILFCFRRHKGSITATRRFSQVINELYIQDLFIERQRTGGKDSFSDENLNYFRDSHGASNQKVVERENRLLANYNLGIQAVKEHKFGKGIKLIIPSLRSNLVRTVIRTTIKTKNQSR